MTEPLYYGSNASLRELLASPDIAEERKERIRQELRNRGEDPRG
jgi:hypothetical protein